MTLSYIEYPLQDGFIHNWLTAGPQAIPVPEMDSRANIVQKHTQPKSGITKTPVERGPLTEGVFKIGGYEGNWVYTRCAEDHSIDHSATFAACHYLRSWAYTQLVSPSAQTAQFSLQACGPADVWINGKPALRREAFSEGMTTDVFEAALVAGENEVLVRFEGVASPQAQLVLAVRISAAELPGVRIPTLIPALDRRAELEQVYAGLYMEREIYTQDEPVYLVWPGGSEKSAYNDVDFRDASGLIQSRAEDVGKPDDRLFLGNPVSLLEGPCRAVVMPRAWEYYDSHIRISQDMIAYLLGKTRFSSTPYGTHPERCLEALKYAAAREDDLFAEIAKMGLERWDSLESKVITQVIEQVNQRQAGSELTALGLLGMLKRFGSKSSFPQWIKKPAKECLLNFRYGADESGSDLLDFSTEENQIVFYACQILAGQLYPDQVFARSELNGRQQHKKGEKLALAWMQARAAGGFSAWGSGPAYGLILTALSHLVDQARAEPVWGLASVLMDKIFFELALHSYQGTPASSQGKARAAEITGGLLHATAGITRVMWGMGTFNPHISATISLALLKKYELPPIFPEIAAGQPGEVWSREQQLAGGQPVNTAAYRTPFGMLASAQDYHPGQPGAQQHIWQATLGPKSVVFSNHPACASRKEERGPNFWRGNRVLPRVAQWKDALIALYNLPADDPLGYTHAYFPVVEFDEFVLRDNWAFGRKGDGYVALTASQPLQLIQHGPTAQRELRAYGQQTAWLCQLGSTAQDTDFAAFQDKVLAAAIVWDGLSVTWPTPRGETLSFAWQGPLLLNGAEQPLSGFKHFENPYTTAELPCKNMEIKTEQYVLRLDFDTLS